MSFGYSIGDIFAACELIWKISSALSAQSGSDREFRDLISSLGSLHRALKMTDMVLLDYSVSKSSASSWSGVAAGLNPLLQVGVRDSQREATVRAIKFEVNLCVDKMHRFLEASREYTKTLMNKNPGGKLNSKKVKEAWAKISWSLFKKDDVVKLDGDIRRHCEAISLLTSTLGLAILAETYQNSQAHATTFQTLDQKVDDLINMMKILQLQMPSTLGFPWEGGRTANQKPIILYDAIGRELLLPPQICISRRNVHDLLEIAFRGCPGYSKIVRKHYALFGIDASDNELDDANWSRKVYPGASLTMSVWLWQTNHSFNERCPICGWFNRTDSAEVHRNKSIQCVKCNVLFQTLETSHLHILSDAASRWINDATDGVPNFTATSEAADVIKNHGADKLKYKRVHMNWRDKSFKTTVHRSLLVPFVYKPLDVAAALEFLDRLRERFTDRPWIYNRFLDIMKCFKSHLFHSEHTVLAVCCLLYEYKDLLREFLRFKPEGYDVIIPDSPMEPLELIVGQASPRVYEISGEQASIMQDSDGVVLTDWPDWGTETDNMLNKVYQAWKTLDSGIEVSQEQPLEEGHALDYYRPADTFAQSSGDTAEILEVGDTEEPGVEDYLESMTLVESERSDMEDEDKAASGD